MIDLTAEFRGASVAARELGACDNDLRRMADSGELPGCMEPNLAADPACGPTATASPTDPRPNTRIAGGVYERADRGEARSQRLREVLVP